MRWLIKYFIVLASTLVSCSGKTGTPPVVVHESGVQPVFEKSISLLFYATVENKSPEPLTVGLEMERCCQTITQNDTDCESMVLFSGLHVELRPNLRRNLTMYFSNMYLHGRSGYCWLKVLWKPPPPAPKRKFTEGDKFQIPFDLTVPDPNFLQKYIGKDLVKCDSVDQDPKNNCNQVNCLIKYNGFRSFFNETRQRCEPTPLCYDPKTFTVEMESKPTMMLSSITNKCVKLKPGTPHTEDMNSVSKEMPELGALSFRSYPVKVKCAHGTKVRSYDGQSKCNCDSGWNSTDFPVNSFNPAIDTYTMCAHQTPEGEQEEKMRKAFTNLLVLIIILAILGLLLCILIPFYVLKWWKRRKYERLSEEVASPEPSASQVINEVKNRREVILPPIRPDTVTTRTEYLQPQYKYDRKSASASRTSSRIRKRTSPPPRQSESISRENFTLTICPSKPQYLRFPERITRIPPYPDEVECPCSEQSSQTEECYPEPLRAKESWSIPSANANRCPNCYATEKPRYAGASASMTDCFPRRVDSCSSCLNKFSDNHASLTNVIQLKAIRPEAPSDFCDTTFDGHSSRHIEQAAQKLRRELTEDVTGTWSPQSMHALSRSSSTLTTLTEFWREDRASAAAQPNRRQEQEKKQFWVDPFLHSIRHRPSD